MTLNQMWEWKLGGVKDEFQFSYQIMCQGTQNKKKHKGNVQHFI